MLRGSINHVSISVSDLPRAMPFLRPILEFLGYESEGKGDGVGVPLVVSLGGEILDPPGEFPFEQLYRKRGILERDRS